MTNKDKHHLWQERFQQQKGVNAQLSSEALFGLID